MSVVPSSRMAACTASAVHATGANQPIFLAKIACAGYARHQAFARGLRWQPATGEHGEMRRKHALGATPHAQGQARRPGLNRCPHAAPKSDTNWPPKGLGASPLMRPLLSVFFITTTMSTGRSAPLLIRSADSRAARRLKYGYVLCRGGIHAAFSYSKLTCAATTRQPSGVRTQVWLWRPVLSLPSR